MNNSMFNLFMNKFSSILNVTNEIIPIVKDSKPLVSKIYKYSKMNTKKNSNFSNKRHEEKIINDDKKKNSVNNPKFFI